MSVRSSTGPSGIQLERNALSSMDLLIAGMSYMAPGFSLFFTTAIIASIAGIHIPLTYLFAGFGVLCTGAALAEFSRLAPSAGSLQTFVARGFGPIASVAGGLTLIVGYLCLQAGVAALFGGWTSQLLSEFLGVTIPWQVITVAGVAVFTWLMVQGVSLSIRATWILFLIEFVIVVLISAAVIVQGGDTGLRAEPINPFVLDGPALGAIAVGMVFATFSFVGFEGSISFAEETPDPRRALPIAVIGGIVAMVALYIVATYAAVIGFGVDKAAALGADPEPILSLAHRYAGVLEPFLKIAVLTSLGANLMAAGNANARILFNLGREGAVPAALGRVHPRHKTPHVALIIFMAATLVPGLIASTSWDYLTAFGNIAGFGALLALIIYMAATAALPFYVLRTSLTLRPVPHLLVPILGTAIWLVPLWGSLQPNQPFPFNIYPVLALGVVAIAAVYAGVASRTGQAWLGSLGVDGHKLHPVEVEATSPDYEDMT